MRIRDLGSVAVLVATLAGCSATAGGSPAAPSQPGAQQSTSGQTSAAPSASAPGGGVATAEPSKAAGAGASPSQAAGGGTSTGWLSKPCAILTEAEVAGVLHGTMVATPQERMETYAGECEYASEQSGNGATVSLAEGAIPKAQFDQFGAAGQLGTKVEGLGDIAYYSNGEISIWKGDRGVGISIDQSDATDEASLKALVVALGKIAAGRL